MHSSKGKSVNTVLITVSHLDVRKNLLEEFSLCVDVLVDAFVDAVDDEGHGAHTGRLQDAAVAL